MPHSNTLNAVWPLPTIVRVIWAKISMVCRHVDLSTADLIRQRATQIIRPRFGCSTAHVRANRPSYTPSREIQPAPEAAQR